MLTQLTITNFAIIDKLEIIFKEGLTVLTGETGAGKSIIVDALDFLLGARVGTDLIKTGTSKASIEGNFSIQNINENLDLKSWFERNGFDLYGNTMLIISRELSSQGSKVRINGSLANVSHIHYLKEFILDIHQQSEHIELLKTERQLEVLDSFGNYTHKKLINDYRKVFDEYQKLKNRLTAQIESLKDIDKRTDFLEFEVNEIKAAKIENINEDNELSEKRKILLNKKQLTENTSNIYELLNGEDSNNVLSILSQIKKTITNCNEYDSTFQSYKENIENIILELKDIATFANNYRESINEDSKSLSEIEERLDLLFHLKKKYGRTLEDIQNYYRKIKSEFKELKNSNFTQNELQKRFNEKEKEVKNLANDLTTSREEITKSFVNKINDELLTLGFKQAILVIEFTECELLQNGKEQIQFLFSSNPDEPPKPLLKVASGGELSRIMLAIKSITGISRNNSNPTMIFDEVDTGVSGEIASSVAKKLYKIAMSNQVLCITHQPIICAMADNHFVISKNIFEGITSVSLKEIPNVEKAEALAALLTPENEQKTEITKDARLFAKSLLENARMIKDQGLTSSIL